MAKLDKQSKEEIRYYLQPGEEGRKETFAEIFNAISLPWRDAESFEQRFPNTTTVVRVVLDSRDIPLLQNQPFQGPELNKG